MRIRSWRKFGDKFCDPTLREIFGALRFRPSRRPSRPLDSRRLRHHLAREWRRPVRLRPLATSFQSPERVRILENPKCRREGRRHDRPLLRRDARHLPSPTSSRTICECIGMRGRSRRDSLTRRPCCAMHACRIGMRPGWDRCQLLPMLQSRALRRGLRASVRLEALPNAPSPPSSVPALQPVALPSRLRRQTTDGHLAFTSTLCLRPIAERVTKNVCGRCRAAAV